MDWTTEGGLRLAEPEAGSGAGSDLDGLGFGHCETEKLERGQ